MAKKKTPALATITGAKLAAVAAKTTPLTPVITVPPGGTLVVIVDVGEMTIPYTVSYTGRTLIKAFVDRAEAVSLQPGEQVLGWGFAHGMTKGWHHRIGVSVNSAAPIVLESRSEANKDSDHSVNFAIVKS